MMEILGPKRDNKSVGERSQAIILARLAEVGYNVLIPFGENHRYDLVIEDADRQFWRIQCKTGRLDSNQEHIEFNAASNYYHHRKGGTTWGKRTYHGQVEYFVVYCPSTKKVYFIPIDQVTTNKMRLRLSPTRNNQEKNVHWAKDYEL
jgi:PD-(D/E)XK endonuclease